MHDLVIIGGGGAGLTAAIKAKKTNMDARITLINKESVSYSPCSLPFVISGEIEGLDRISHDLREICKEDEITCVIDTVTSIDVKKKVVKVGSGREFPYTSLIIATGSLPSIPPTQGIDLKGVYTLQWIEDAQAILEELRAAKNAVVIGGGSVGLEMAEAFIKRGIKVTMIQRSGHVLRRSLDPEFSKMVEDELMRNGVEILFNTPVKEIRGEGGHVNAVVTPNGEIPADIVLFGVGAVPNVELARNAGIKVDEGGIDTDDLMQTNIDDVYAAGDCVDSMSIVTGKLMLSQLGTTAIRQGTVAGMNAVGGYVTFEGVLNSMVLKLFDLEVGRTGLTVKDAEAEGIKVVIGTAVGKTKAEYFPGAKDVKIKLVFNALNRRLIGAQIAGAEGVAGKIDLLAFAIANNAEIVDLMKLKYCYTPPITPSHNLIVLAAENAFKKLRRFIEVRKRRF
ncbi:MAG: FAD-dependent oxidoreductase [Candidatus Altiarchaeota archaeon]|nr:FAD-dependent oxidoreductase [Candidatus Altiarchaeota archaeon]